MEEGLKRDVIITRVNLTGPRGAHMFDSTLFLGVFVEVFLVEISI